MVARSQSADTDDLKNEQIREGGPQGNQPYRKVVGVVADVKQSGMDSEARTEVFLPVTQFPFAPWTELQEMTFVVRTNGDPAGFASSARRELREVAKDLPVTSVRTMSQSVAGSLERRNFSTTLLMIFALLALLLAAVGTYGVMAYSVTQRAHEISVRMALGATPRAIALLVLRKAVTLAGIGIALGCIGSLLSGQWLASYLFGVRPTDPITLATVALVLLAVAILASLIPVRRASSVEPAAVAR